MSILGTDAAVNFVHVNGGYDAFKPFFRNIDGYNIKRQRVFSGFTYSEGGFWLSHHRQDEPKARINLFGHTHKAYFSEEGKKQEIVPEEKYGLGGEGPFFINPGAFNLGFYCTIEGSGSPEGEVVFKNLRD